MFLAAQFSLLNLQHSRNISTIAMSGENVNHFATIGVLLSWSSGRIMKRFEQLTSSSEFAFTRFFFLPSVAFSVSFKKSPFDSINVTSVNYGVSKLN